MKVEHEHAATLTKLADKIAEDAARGVGLSDQDKMAVMWVATLLEDRNVRLTVALRSS